MKTLKSHISEVFSTAPQVENIEQLCSDLKTVVNDQRARNEIALHVLALVSSSIKAHVHSKKALHAAMREDDHED